MKVKALPPGPTQSHWYYGPDYMARISRADAKKLAGMYPLPDMGSEIVVAIKPDPICPSFRLRATVQNVSGSYFLASTDTRRENWKDVFGIEVKGGAS